MVIMLDLIEESDWAVRGAKPPEKKIVILSIEDRFCLMKRL